MEPIEIVEWGLAQAKFTTGELRNSGKHLGKSSEHGQNPFSKFINFILGTSSYSDSTANCSADVTCCKKRPSAPTVRKIAGILKSLKCRMQWRRAAAGI